MYRNIRLLHAAASFAFTGSGGSCSSEELVRGAWVSVLMGVLPVVVITPRSRSRVAVPSDCGPDCAGRKYERPGHAKVPAVAGTLTMTCQRDASGVGALAVVRAVLLASAALASGLAHSRPPEVVAQSSVSKEAARSQSAQEPLSVIWIRTSRSWRRTRSRSDSGADSEQDLWTSCLTAFWRSWRSRQGPHSRRCISTTAQSAWSSSLSMK